MTDAGPADLGTVFDFDFGALDPGDTQVLRLFYGAASTEADALSAAGAEAYSLAQPSVPGGETTGSPNTFMFGFASGDESPSCSEEGTCEVICTARSTRVAERDEESPNERLAGASGRRIRSAGGPEARTARWWP